MSDCEHHWHYKKSGVVRYTAPLQWAVVCCKCAATGFACVNGLFECGRKQDDTVGKPAPVQGKVIQ